MRRTRDGDLVVAYKESRDHHITDQDVLYASAEPVSTGSFEIRFIIIDDRSE